MDARTSPVEPTQEAGLSGRARVSLAILAGVMLPVVLVAVGQTAATSVPPSKEVNVTNDPSRRWAESGIAVNPKNPNNIVIATQGLMTTRECFATNPECMEMVPVDLGMGGPRPQVRGQTDNPNFTVVAAFVTFNRGNTWKRVNFKVVPRGFPSIRSAGDPHITAGPDGTFYFSFDSLNWGTAQKALPNAGVSISKSTDGGLTWSEPIMGGTPADGPKITADLSTGTIYVASSSQIGPRSTGDPNAPVQPKTDRWLTSSKDGVNWVKPPRGMGGVGGMSAAHGVLANAFRTAAQASIMGSANVALCGDAPKPCVIFQTTTDSGANWTRNVVTVPSDFTGGPMVAADPSKKGHFALAVPMKASGGFYVMETLDSGKTWSQPVAVTEDAGKRHYHSWMAYSRQGALGIMWRTSQPLPPGQKPETGEEGGPPSLPYNVWAVVSRNGGKTFSAPLQASGATSPAAQRRGSGGDDYSGLAVDGNYVYVVWADWRSKERDNYFRAIPFSAFKAK